MISSVISVQNWRTLTLVAGWFAASVGVWAWTVAYGTTTAQPAHVALADPAPIVGGQAIVRPTLYLFMHPRCPCTRATIAQLQRVLTTSGLDRSELPEVSVVATIPSGVSEDDDAWLQSGTLHQAAELPNSTVYYDDGGARARSFGAQASGVVALYAADGRLLFAGGVTVSRGHDGDSLGAEQLLKQIQEPTEGAPVTAPALGCRLCLED